MEKRQVLRLDKIVQLACQARWDAAQAVIRAQDAEVKAKIAYAVAKKNLAEYIGDNKVVIGSFSWWMQDGVLMSHCKEQDFTMEHGTFALPAEVQEIVNL